MHAQVLTRWLRLWRWLIAHPWLLLALFGSVLLLLGLISLLADAVPTPHRRWVHDPLGLAVQRRATPALDTGMRLVSQLGSPWGVVPLGSAILIGLRLRRRTADGVFVRLAVGGAALLMHVAKRAFSREPPTVWPSLMPEPTFRFPSVHTLGSMTVVAAVVVLIWPTRWRAARACGGIRGRRCWAAQILHRRPGALCWTGCQPAATRRACCCGTLGALRARTASSPQEGAGRGRT